MFTIRRKEPAQDTLRGQNEVSLDMLYELPNLFHYAADGNVNKLKEFVPTAQAESPLLNVDDNCATLLHHAAVHNQTAVMQYLIDCGVHCDAVDNDGNTPLHLATIHGNIEAVHLLLDNGATDTILNKARDAPLHFAVRVNKPKLVQAFVCRPQVEILQPGPDMNTPIHIAAMHDNADSFKVLCESSQMVEAVKSNKISAKNSDGLTAIHVAVCNGSHRVLELIIRTSQLLGCSTKVELELLNKENFDPLRSAVEAGYLEIVNVLLRFGAIPTKCCGNKIPPLHLACAQGKFEMVRSMVKQYGSDILTQRDQYGRLPVFYGAISSHSPSIIAYFDENGVSLNATEDDGCTPLHFAIKCGNLSSVKELLSRGANPLIKNSHGRNSAHFAVTFNRKKIVVMLSAHKTFSQLFTEKDNDRDSAILLALRKGYGKLVLPLLSSNQLHLQSMYDAESNNCLHLAAASNDWTTLRVLLDENDFSDSVNKLNSKGETPLHLAAQGGDTRSVEILLSHGALVNRSSNDTALMRACFNGHSKCVLILHKTYPFQRDWKDQTGNSALHYAALGGNPKTLATALDIGCKISKNVEGLTFIDILIASTNQQCALEVVNHSRCQECLDYPSKCDPMFGLIQQLPIVAKRVLDRCHQCASVDRGHPEYWERFDFKYLQPSRMRSMTELQTETSTDLLPEEMSRDNTNSMTALRKMVKCKRLGLLVHPVVEKYITDKWNTYGIWIYLVSFLLRLIAAILLSAFVLVVPHPDLVESQNSTQELSNHTSNQSDGEFTLTASAQALRVTALLVNFLLTLLIILPLTATISRLLTRENAPILVYILSIVCTYIFLLAPIPLNLWIVGALSSFFSWLAVIMGLLFFELSGIYVKMFITVTTTVLKVLLVSFFLIMAFAFPFYILANPLPNFASIGYSLITLFIYMLGEVQYELIIPEDQSSNLLCSSCSQ